MDDSHEAGFKPPYMAFTTLWNFLETLASHPLPPAIDRSLMQGKSGSDQANIFNALKAFGLLGEGQVVLPALTELTSADVEGRKLLLADLVRRHYPGALEVSDRNGTSTQLDAKFREDYGLQSGDTLRKSVTFFLHAARTAGIPLSPHFKQTRSGQGAPGQPKRRTAKRTARTAASPAAPAETPSVPTEAYRLEITLQTGGTMTLTVNVNPINLRGDDRDFFYDIVDKMSDYEQPAAQAGEEPTSAGSPDTQT